MTRRALLALALVGLAAALYLTRLGSLPIYFGGDEAHFGNQAYAIATTGRDLGGRPMPLFFNLTSAIEAGQPAGDRNVRWYQPTLFYLTAAALRVLPLSTASVRLPVALVGIADVLLLFLVATRLLRDELRGFAAALFLLFSPAHVIFSRQATDYICVVPVALVWLLCVTTPNHAKGVWLPFGVGLLLGAGLYSYISAWVLMPILLVLTWITQFESATPARACTATAAGFLLLMLPGAWWMWRHPQMLNETLGRYQMAAPRAGFAALQSRFLVYLDYFNPVFLFRTGGASMTTATHRSGVFPLALAVFLPVGICVLAVRRRVARIGLILLAGLAVAAIPATLVEERFMIQRELMVLPFGALIAGFGFEWLLRSGRIAVRMAALVALASIPLQAAYFWYDYSGNYQRRSAFYFDPADFKDIADYVIDEDRQSPVPLVYLSGEIDDAAPRWRFQLTSRRREDLLRRTRCLDCDARPDGATAGSLAVVYADAPKVGPYVESGRWAVAKVITDVDGREASKILRRVK